MKLLSWFPREWKRSISLLLLLNVTFSIHSMNGTILTTDKWFWSGTPTSLLIEGSLLLLYISLVPLFFTFEFVEGSLFLHREHSAILTVSNPNLTILTFDCACNVPSVWHFFKLRLVDSAFVWFLNLNCSWYRRLILSSFSCLYLNSWSRW